MSRIAGQTHQRPTLLLAAHGTQVEAGVRTIDRLVCAVRVRRPELRIERAFLDVLEPSLANVLTPDLGPTVVVPLLLSTGYHVSQDIPSVVAERPDTVVSRHLGPDPLLTVALVDRLDAARAARADRAARPAPAGTVALVATGSSNPAAEDDLRAAADLLADALGRDVVAASIGDPGLDRRLRGCTEVASYLLAEGFFEQSLRARASSAGIDVVSEVLGAHPAVVELVLTRYEAAATAAAGSGAGSR